MKNNIEKDLTNNKKDAIVKEDSMFKNYRFFNCITKKKRDETEFQLRIRGIKYERARKEGNILKIYDIFQERE